MLPLNAFCLPLAVGADAAVGGYKELFSPASNDFGGLTRSKMIRQSPRRMKSSRFFQARDIYYLPALEEASPESGFLKPGGGATQRGTFLAPSTQGMEGTNQAQPDANSGATSLQPDAQVGTCR